MRDREFRDALTRAVGAIKGEDTNTLQWDRFNP
jgi:hypothetical protein